MRYLKALGVGLLFALGFALFTGMIGLVIAVLEWASDVVGVGWTVFGLVTTLLFALGAGTYLASDRGTEW